jgi:hypothetical protein
MTASGTIVRTSTNPAACAAADTGGTAVVLLRGAGGRTVAPLVAGDRLTAPELLAVPADDRTPDGLVEALPVAVFGARVQPAQITNSSSRDGRRRMLTIR